MSTKVFGVRIYLDDHASIVTEDTLIGLYNVTSNAASDAAAAQKDVVVADGSIFTAGELVTISDSVASETNRVSSIASNTLTMVNNLINTYTTANSAKVDANSRFRWVQNAISTVTTWKEGIIAAGGIRPYTREIDLSRGGNIASPGTGEVVIKNTNKFFDTIYDKEIYLNGLKCEVMLFTDATPAVQWTGICGSPSWTAKEYTIPLSGYYTKRVANIGTFVTEAGYANADSMQVGKIVPVSIGKFVPDINYNQSIERASFARFNRIVDKQEIFRLYNHVIMDGSGASTAYIVIFNTGRVTFERSIFPVVDTPNFLEATPLTYRIRLFDNSETNYRWFAIGGHTLTPPFNLDQIIGNYIRVVEGDGAGELRYIDSAVYPDVAAPLAGRVIDIRVSQYFKTELAYNSTATAARQTWVQIVDVERVYKADVWPCKSLLNIFGEEISTMFDLWAYTNDQSIVVDALETRTQIKEENFGFKQIPQHAYTATSSDNNSLDLDIKTCLNDYDSIVGYLIYPVESAELYGANNLLLLNKTGDTTFNSFSKISDGIFKAALTGQITTAITGSLDNITDAAYTPAYQIKCNVNATIFGYEYSLALVVSCKLPSIPRVSFDTCNLLIGVYSNIVGGLAGGANVNVGVNIVRIGYIRFMGGLQGVLTDGTANAKFNGRFEDLPLWYAGYSSDKSLMFYRPDTDTSGDVKLVYGVTNFVLPRVTNWETYQAVEKLFIANKATFAIVLPTTGAYFQLGIREAAIAIGKTVSIKNTVYSPFSARIYNDTWGSGRGIVRADLMTAPHRILEHVCRLQNWSENSIVPSDGWGKGYADNALIKTTGDGSFDDTTDDHYTVITDMQCAAQFTKDADTYTDKLKRTLCRDFFLANWVNKDGYECVKRIRRNNTTIADADKLTLANIVDRQSIKIIDPAPSDIYPEPFVRYNYNQASEGYDSAIRIFNVSGTWASTNVEGLTGSDAQEYWNRCVNLWQRSHAVNKPPSDLTDLTWANGEQADAIAKEYLECWIDWMYNPSIIFKTTFAKAGAWEECKRFSINLPHQTNAVAIECMLTEIAVDPNPPYYVTIKAIMFSETIPEDFNIKKTLDAFGTDAGDWVKTLTAYGTDNDIIKVT